MRLVVFGYGFSGRTLAQRLMADGWDVAAITRNPATAEVVVADGARPIDVADHQAVAAAITGAQALLITAPPGPLGCPGLAAVGQVLTQARPDWIGYLSTTGVYGDRRGGWVTERSSLVAQSVEAARRVGAERDWLARGAAGGQTVTIFRLPGIYGPGRSTLDRIRAGRARRIALADQVFSRIHVDDLAAGLVASIRRPRAGGIYNLCDDEPAPNSDVVAYGARLLGLPVPPEVALADARLPPSALRFYAETKRVSNALAKAELGWRPAFPTYRDGLRAVLAAEVKPR